MDRRIIAAVSSVVLAGATASVTLAASYASQVSESAGNITFTLNEKRLLCHLACVPLSDEDYFLVPEIPASSSWIEQIASRMPFS